MTGTLIAEAGSVLRSALLLSLLVGSLSSHAAIWGSRGITYDFAFRGNHLVVADGRGVTVYDVASPAAIRRIDVETGDYESHDVAVSGNDLVALATDFGVEWFALAADGTLTRQGTYGDDGPATDVAANATHVAAGGARKVTILEREGHALDRTITIALRSAVKDQMFVGELLYVALESGGIAIFDPRTGANVQTILVQSPSFALAGDVLWVGGGQTGIYAYDVSDPRNPKVLMSRVGDRQIHADEVAFANDHLYVRDGSRLIRIYDVGNFASATQVGQLDEWVHLLVTRGDELFLAGTIRDREDLPFATGVPVRVLDVSNPVQPQLAGEFRDFAGPLSGVFTSGSIAYVSDPPFFRTIDISRTNEPREMASIEVADLQDSVRVKDGRAIVYGRGFVNLIDVSDPWNLKLLSTWDALGHPISSAALMRADTYVEANQHSGLHIMDITDPTKPWQIGGRIWHYHDVAAGDDVVYALQHSAFRALDIRTRTTVVDAWSHNQTTFLQIDTVPPNSAAPGHLITSHNDGLFIWSLQNRFAPRHIATAPLERPGIFGTSESGAVVAYDGELWRVDLAGGFANSGLRVMSPMQISAAGAKIAVADRYGLRVYGPDTAPPPPKPEDPPTQPGKRRAVRGR